jgi:Fe-S oxidoreductase
MHEEALTPHGWALMIASVRRGLLSWNEETVDRLYSAPDGGNSRAHCVTNQPLPEAIAATRAQVAAQQLAPAEAYEVDDLLQEWGNPYGENAPQPPGGQGDVALFVGDDAHYLEPQTVQAALSLLRALDVEPVLIGVGRNNGFMASSLGFPDTACALAQATLDELAASTAQQLLVLSPGDYFTFNQLYPERLDISWPQDVGVQEISAFLAAKLDQGALQFEPLQSNQPYAYIDPTHAVRVPARHDAPRALAASVLSSNARELFWRRERSHPAGNTALQFTKPVIAGRLTQARLEDAREAGAELLLTDDPGTLHHLKRHAPEMDLSVQSLYELLAANLKSV